MSRIRIRPINGWIAIALFLIPLSTTGCQPKEIGSPANEAKAPAQAPRTPPISTTQSADRHGLDVSHHQGDVHWAKVKAAGKSFVFIKATEGDDYTDPSFASYWHDSKEAGLVRGAYHFFRPEDDAKTQAQHFIATVTLEPGDLAPALDVEVTDGVSSADLIDGIKAWFDLVEAAYGVQPILYSDLHFVQAEMTQSQLSSYPLWLADYSETPPEAPGAWTHWTFWQYSQSGVAEGIDDVVDLNLFQGTLEAWEALLFAGVE